MFFPKFSTGCTIRDYKAKRCMYPYMHLFAAFMGDYLHRHFGRHVDIQQRNKSGSHISRITSLAPLLLNPPYHTLHGRYFLLCLNIVNNPLSVYFICIILCRQKSRLVSLHVNTHKTRRKKLIRHGAERQRASSCCDTIISTAPSRAETGWDCVFLH